MTDSFATPWTVACQAPLSLGFSGQEYWNGLPFPSPGELPHSGIEPVSPALTGGFFTAERPGNPGGAFASMETRVLVSPLSVHPLSNSTLAPELSPSTDAHSPRDYVCLRASFSPSTPPHSSGPTFLLSKTSISKGKGFIKWTRYQFASVQLLSRV